MPTPPAPDSALMMRNESPDSISSASHIIPKTIVWPKSGCFIRNKPITPVNNPDRGITGSVLSCARSDNSHASATTKQGFRNSDGWIWAKP